MDYNFKFRKMDIKNKEISDITINEVLQKFDLNKLKDKSKKKLLIIPCSDKKRASGTEFYERNYFNSENYKYLNVVREIRKYHYLEHIDSNPYHFIGKKDILGNGNIVPIDSNYFKSCLNGNNYVTAMERYEGKFYTNEHRILYFEKNSNANLYILIVSGLYGLLQFNDEIIDYHFEISNGPNIWGNCLTKTIKQYINENEIEDDMVFYSLSEKYLKNIIPSEQWNNLWINNIGNSRQANLKYSADCVLRFLNLL